jgi:hypothetical protein
MISKLKLLVISIFIITNFMMMIRAQLPKNSRYINSIYTPITFIQNYLSLWRGWSMFAPDPLKINGFLDAKIIFKDGTDRIWTLPTPHKLNSIPRYLYGERFRKYNFEALRLDSKKHLWPDAAKFVLKKTKDIDKSKTPTKIILRRRWLKIPDWNTNFIKHRTKAPAPNRFKTYEFYTFKVKS